MITSEARVQTALNYERAALQAANKIRDRLCKDFPDYAKWVHDQTAPITAQVEEVLRTTAAYNMANYRGQALAFHKMASLLCPGHRFGPPAEENGKTIKRCTICTHAEMSSTTI